MKIAIVDVAAESSGAASVLFDFVEALGKSPLAQKHEWLVLTGLISVPECGHIRNIRVPEVKKSRMKRLLWERREFPRLMEKEGVDVVVSLQNKALPKGKWRQVVYFHNMLLLSKASRFSLFKKEERPYAIYTHLIGPLTRNSWKHASLFAVQTHAAADTIGKYLPKGAKVLVLPPAIKPYPVGNEAWDEVGGLIYPAAPIPFKRQDALVSRVQMPRGRQLLLTMTGHENGYAERVRALADGKEGIRFTGYLPREEILSGYDRGTYGLIVVSEIESYPIPFAEAMQAGAPIVAADYPYAREVLGDYENAFFVRPDLGDLNDGIARALAAKRCAPKLPAGGSWEDFIVGILEVGGAE